MTITWSGDRNLHAVALSHLVLAHPRRVARHPFILGCGVWKLWFYSSFAEFQGFGFRVESFGFEGWGLGFGVQCKGFLGFLGGAEPIHPAFEFGVWGLKFAFYF